MLYKFIILVMKSLGRNKVRTAVTGLGVIVLVAIYAIVTNVTSMVKSKISAGDQTRLIVSERWTMPSKVPMRYIPEITKLRGVKNWTSWSFFVGFCDKVPRSDRQAAVLAVYPNTLREMHGGLDQLPDDVYEEWLQTKDAILVGSAMMQKMGWHVGQQVTVFGARFPPVDMVFKIIGVLPGGDWSSAVFCRQDYLSDAAPGESDIVNAILLSVDSEERAKELASELSREYENRQPALKIETESAGVARFASRSTAVLQIVDAVVAILLIDMVIILSNSISISVRERRVEMAVLKVLGFQPMHIAGMIIGEAMLVGGIAGMIGTGIVCTLSTLTQQGTIPLQAWNAFLLQFPVPWSAVAWSGLLGAAVGLTGSVFPAMACRKVKVSDVFARIA
ncbi:MAG TPA: ABC transporter permease [Planctomycetaceae bacterium]|nr:ABC transporter permease [Planctomycetaceae bacterium]